MTNYFIPPHIRHALSATLAAKGLDVPSIIGEVSPDHLNSPEYELWVCHRLLQAAWYLLDDENLGLGDGPPLKPGAFFYASNLMINAPNLGEALKVAASFYTYVCQSWQAEVVTTEKFANFRIHRTGKSRDSSHLLADYLLIGFYQFAGWLIGERISLKRVCFDYPGGKLDIEFRTLFPCQRIFNHDCLELSFNNSYFQQPIVQNARALEELLLSSPSFFLNPQQSTRNYQTEVRHLLEAWPSAKLPDGEKVADILNLTPKMLGTRLKNEGTNLNEIKKQVRLDKACHLLIHHNYSIEEIAEKLGYEETAAFSKAFKLWTRETPAQYRKAHSQKPDSHD